MKAAGATNAWPLEVSVLHTRSHSAVWDFPGFLPLLGAIALRHGTDLPQGRSASDGLQKLPTHSSLLSTVKTGALAVV